MLLPSRLNVDYAMQYTFSSGVINPYLNWQLDKHWGRLAFRFMYFTAARYCVWGSELISEIWCSRGHARQGWRMAEEVKAYRTDHFREHPLSMWFAMCSTPSYPHSQGRIKTNIRGLYTLLLGTRVMGHFSLSSCVFSPVTLYTSLSSLVDSSCRTTCYGQIDNHQVPFM